MKTRLEDWLMLCAVVVAVVVTLASCIQQKHASPIPMRCAAQQEPESQNSTFSERGDISGGAWSISTNNPQWK